MINKVTLVGNIGKDPELSTLSSGNKVCKFSLATSESYKDKAGEWQEQTEWHNIVFWGDQAERAAKLSKGNTIYLEGKITYHSYEDKNGQKRYVSEVKGSFYRILKREASNQPKESVVTASEAYGRDIPGTGADDDLPF